MERYTINEIDSEKYDGLLTILDQDADVMECIKDLDRKKYKKILVDTLLINGIDNRFLAVNDEEVKENVEVMAKELYRADEVLRVKRDYIRHAAIYEKQKK